MTLRPVRRTNKTTGQTVTKWAKRNSFFNFFSPPNLSSPGGRSPEDLARQAALLDAHHDLGMFLKDCLVPRAVAYFFQEEEESKRNSRALKVKIRKTSKEEKEHLVKASPEGAAASPDDRWRESMVSMLPTFLRLWFRYTA